MDDEDIEVDFYTIDEEKHCHILLNIGITLSITLTEDQFLILFEKMKNELENRNKSRPSLKIIKNNDEVEKE